MHENSRTTPLLDAVQPTTVSPAANAPLTHHHLHFQQRNNTTPVTAPSLFVSRISSLESL